MKRCEASFPKGMSPNVFQKSGTQKSPFTDFQNILASTFAGFIARLGQIAQQTLGDLVVTLTYDPGLAQRTGEPVQETETHHGGTR